MIGRHEAATHQLLCVVTGEGWVSGPDSNRIPIAVGRAAFWGRGEEHETGTDTGHTAIVLEGQELSVWAAPDGSLRLSPQRAGDDQWMGG